MVYFSMTDSAMFVYINDDTCKGNDWLWWLLATEFFSSIIILWNYYPICHLSLMDTVLDSYNIWLEKNIQYSL